MNHSAPFSSIVLIWLGCLPVVSAAQQLPDEYLKNVEAQATHFELGANMEESVCERLLMWYLDYQAPEYLNLLGGPEQLKSTLSGKCFDRMQEWQVPLMGREGRLSDGYLITVKYLGDRILLLLDPLGDGEREIRNTKIIAYHLKSGQLRNEFINR